MPTLFFTPLSRASLFGKMSGFEESGPVDYNAVLKQLLDTDSNPSLSEIYAHFCKHCKVAADQGVIKILDQVAEPSHVKELDLSTLIFAPPAFDAVMQVSRLLPNLSNVNLANTNMKPESVQSLVEMAAEHPSLTSLSLANNNSLGFSAAKLLLPLIKENKRFIELDVEGTCMAAPTKELIKKVLLSNRTYMENQPQGTRMRSPDSPLSPAHQDGLVISDVEQAQTPEYAPVVPVTDEVMPVAKADAPDPTTMNLMDTKARNHELKSSLMDHEERLHLYHVEMVNKCDGKQKDVKRRHNVGADMMESFKNGWKWPLRSDFKVATCVTDFALNLSEEELQDFYKYYTPQMRATYLNVKGVLTELLDKNTTRRRKNVLIEDLLAKVKGHGPGMSILVELVQNLCELLAHEATNMDAIQGMLEETDIQIGDVKIKIDKTETNRQRALKEEELQEAEGYFEVGLDTQERLIDTILFRLSHLLDKGPRNNLLDGLRKLCEQADEQMNETKHINDDLMGKIDQDLKRIQQKVFEEQEGMKYREQEFLDVQERMKEELSNNQRQQEKVWRDITYSFKELQELAEGRFKEVENWMKEVEKHERRKVEYNAVLKVCEDHSKTLSELQHDCNNCEQLLRNFDEFIRVATKTITTMADTTSGEIDRLALEEQETYLGVFRTFYMQLGELLFKKQKRLEETDRMIRNCEFQIDFCKETLDPDLHKYRDQLKELTQRRQETADTVARMQVRGDDRAAQFMPHEDALRAAGREFESPLLEMHEDVVDRRARVLAQRQRFIDKDKEELVDKEAVGIETLVNHTQQARKTGISSLIHPLSPKSPGPSPGRSDSNSQIIPPQDMIPNVGSPQAPRTTLD
jgi:hypothetical protein